MYKFKTSEQNNDKATEFETKSLLYLVTKIKGHRGISLFIIDCFNDVIGVFEDYSDSWDIQSKNVASLTPRTIGKALLSTKKENIMIKEYQKTGVQVILSSTLKDEEYSSGTKYYNMDGVNAINYESNPNSHILQSIYCERFMSLVDSFGIVY